MKIPDKYIQAIPVVLFFIICAITFPILWDQEARYLDQCYKENMTINRSKVGDYCTNKYMKKING